jgi:hypothetical protein
MKSGIIIIFNNYEKEIDKDTLIKYCSKTKNFEYCFVNNYSKDDTYNVLKYIKEKCENVSVVNVKKLKSEISAVRSGARYFLNNFKLLHIGYINANALKEKNKSLNEIIYFINRNEHDFLEYDKNLLNKSTVKQTHFQRLYSVVDYLIKLDI